MIYSAQTGFEYEVVALIKERKTNYVFRYVLRDKDDENRVVWADNSGGLFKHKCTNPKELFDHYLKDNDMYYIEYVPRDVSKTNTLSHNEQAFKDIVDNMFKVYKAKNHDYGSSVQDTYEDYGDVSFLVRITDKLNRLKTLCKSDVEAKVADEKIEDTILDLANYAILFKITRDASNK